MIASLYVDGGLLSVNPSEIGGSWAFVAVSEAGDQVAYGSGIVTPAECGSQYVTNNTTELLAAVRGLQAMPDGWAGTLWTDSGVTLTRLTKTNPLGRAVPKWLREELNAKMVRLGMFTVKLVAGHPTRRDLARGHNRSGTPASSWNVLCDRLCNEEAERFRRERMIDAWLMKA